MISAAPTLWQRIRYTRLRDMLRGRFDAGLDWRLVVAEADLPAEVNIVISDVVHRTRLWRREKLDVASELIAHFQDGLEAARTTDQLLSTFGDARQAARLIRRAKKRGRPLPWHIGRYALWACAVVLLLYLAMGVYLLMGRPSIKTDYLKIINQRAASVPEAQRAWPHYRQALLALRAEKTNDESPFYSAGDVRPKDSAWSQAENFLAEHEKSIADLRRAASMPNLGFPVWSEWKSFPVEDRLLISGRIDGPPEQQFDKLEDRMLVGTLLPHAQLLRPAGRLLLTDARRAARAGDGETALANVVALLGISRHVEETPFLVNSLVATAIHNMAYEAVRDILHTHADLWTNAQLRDLAHRLATAQIDWRRGFEGERASFHDILQRMYTDNGDGDGRPVFSGLGMFQAIELLQPPDPNRGKSMLSNDVVAFIAAPAASALTASRKEMAETYDVYLDRMMLYVETPMWEKQKITEVSTLSSERYESIEDWRYWLVRWLVPSLENLRKSQAASNGWRDGALIGIALEMYHRENDAWPKSLDELAPRWLPTLPVDRATGKPLHYTIRNDRPVVYSLGADLDDDGGRIVLDDVGRQKDPWPYSRAAPAQEPPPDDGDWMIWSAPPN